MSDSLKDEFVLSFGNYVSEDGPDVRRVMLGRMLTVPVDQLVGKSMLEPQDFAALVTVAAFVKPRQLHARRLMVAYQSWQVARQDAEYDGEDPNEIVFEPSTKVEDVEILLDPTVDGLAEFFRALPTVDGGRVYMAQVLVCLMWSHQMPHMSPNLWSPQVVGKE